MWSPTYIKHPAIFPAFSVWKLMAILVFSLFFFSACKTSNKQKIAEQIVAEWIGKEIHFPDAATCSVMGKDTFSLYCERLYDANYKILLYVDSAGCSGCRLKLFEWKQLIEESDSLFQGRLGFLFFFQPKSNDTEEIEFLLHRYRFDYPVFLDTYGLINSLNGFPQEVDFQCFLLDRQNRVILVGNPVLNPQIWELYQSAIVENSKPQSVASTTVKFDKSVHEYGHIKKYKTYKAEFTIENSGENPLILYQVSASCGCTEVEWDKRPVMPHQRTTIKVTLALGNEGLFNKVITVYGNIEPSPLVLRVTGTVDA